MPKQMTYERLTSRAAFLFALAVVLWSGGLSEVEGSILLPDTGLQGDTVLDAEQLIADLEEQASSSSGASSSDSQTASEPSPEERSEPNPTQENLAQQLAAMASQSEGSTSGTSSSSGSSSASGGVSLLADDAVTVPNSTPARRYASERALLIPDAPGNKLLRPPQA